MSLDRSLIEHSQNELFDNLIDCPEEYKKTYIQSLIIPQMNSRRSRTEPLSSDEINARLYNLPNSDKPGEEHELAQALINSGDEMITPELALEYADVTYYYLQQNYKWTGSEDTFMYFVLGGWDLAYSFCIVKYVTRLIHGDSANYKDIEKDTMTSFLKKLKQTEKYKWLGY